ncbi:MAG: hypothetical protein KDA05_00130, partial [Phycisphaerales bacterium]|nr:hypothetical protein [Phycisphaerales bacterium]
MNLLSMFGNLSPAGKVGVLLLVGASPLGILAAVGFGNIVLLIFIVMAFVGMLLLVFKLVLSKIDKGKSKKMEKGVKEQASAGPAGGLDAASRARMDDLRKSWEEGILKFRERGKDLYSVPWYPMVGESGSGKTEAIRHCNVGFPPGLQDRLQGSGGTLNMHWWFTNQSVIIDTAGRLLQDSGRQEWRQFLRMLRKARPLRPINGLLLVIPADSLIKDTGDDLERKGGRLASALDEIQEELGVRFPVYVIITKCDLINGFREYFDAMPDPELKLQEQMLGWSNPSPLDEAFDPSVVEEHLKSVRSRLIQRRYQMLLDPVHTEDSTRRRIEQVDAMYSFPDALLALAPRLRRYLEMVFVAGEWSRKPLFIRGIYFTSSMQEGAALDAELAEALGIRIADLQQQNVEARREKTFFLRDVFVAKVFKEFGLVTSATNVKKSQGAQRTLLVGIGFVAAVLVLGWTVWAFLSLKNSIGSYSEFWQDTARGIGQRFDKASIVVDYGSSGYEYFGGQPVPEALVLNEVGMDSIGDLGRNEYYRLPSQSMQIAQEASQEGVSIIFAPIAAMTGGDPFDGQVDAHAALFEGTVLFPLVRATRQEILEASREGAADRPEWTDQATAALAQLIRVQAAEVNRATLIGAEAAAMAASAAQPGGEGGGAGTQDLQAAGRDAASRATIGEFGGVPQIGPMLRFLLSPSATPEDLDTHIAAYQEVSDTTYASMLPNRWKNDTSARLRDAQTSEAIRLGTRRFVATWQERASQGGSVQLDRLTSLRNAMVEFDAAERAMWTPLTLVNARTLQEYANGRREWMENYGRLERAATALRGSIEALGGNVSDLQGVIDRAKGELLEGANGAYTQLLREIPGGERPASVLSRTDYTVLRDAEAALRGGQRALREGVDAQIAAINESLRVLHAPMLARVGGPTGPHAFERRFAMFQAANGRIVAAGAVGESSLDAGVLTLAGVLEGSRGQAAAATQAIAEAERDITSGTFEQERLDGAKLACQRAIAAAQRKIGYDAISMALGQVDSTRAVEAMVRGAAQASPAGVAELRPMEMTDSINGIDVDPKYDPAAAGRAFAAITTALGLVGASEDPNAAGAVLERTQIDGMVADAQGVMRDYASDYVRYWGEQVPEALYRVRPNGTWAEFQTAASRLNRRTIGGNIESNGEVLRDALAVVGPQLLESERDRDLLALQRRIAAHEADVGGVNETASTAQRLLSSFANLPSLVPAARQRVLAMDVGAFENDFLNYFYLTNDDGEVIRYWRYMTLAAFEKLAAESNDQAGAALLSLQQ